MSRYLADADAEDDPHDSDFEPLSPELLRLTEKAVDKEAGKLDVIPQWEAAVVRLEWFEYEEHPLPPRRRQPARTGTQLRLIVQQFFLLALEAMRTARSLALGRGDPICRFLVQRVARHWVHLWPGGRAAARAL